jgi:hypothetical protein
MNCGEVLEISHPLFPIGRKTPSFMAASLFALAAKMARRGANHNRNDAHMDGKTRRIGMETLQIRAKGLRMVKNRALPQP